MKHTLIALLLLITTSSSAQNWLWAQNIWDRAGQDNLIWQSARDTSGNIVISGVWGFEGNAPYVFNLGSYSFTGSKCNFFLAKCDTLGNVLWAKTFPTDSPTNNIFGCDIAVDHHNNIYMAGTYTSKHVYLDSFILNSDNSSSPDGFIAKFGPTGDVQWVNSIYGDSAAADYIESVVTDSHDNVYISGTTLSRELHLNSTSIHPHGSLNIFIAKYNPDGAIVWARTCTPISNSNVKIATNARSMASDEYDGIYITGLHETPFAIGLDSFKTEEIYGTNSFILKLDTFGNMKWARDVGLKNIYTEAICTDNFGDVYVSGYFTTSRTWIDGISYGNVGGRDDTVFGDILVAKFSGDGNLHWVRAFGTRNHDHACAITSDHSGHIFIAGSFSYGIYNNYTIRFDTVTLSAVGFADHMYMAALYASTGFTLFGFQLPCGGESVNLTADRLGGLYVTAGQTGTDPLLLGNYSLVITGNENTFIARYGTELPMSVAPFSKSGIDKINIYPNPTTGNATIQIEDEYLEKVNFTLFNLQGKEVYKTDIPGNAGFLQKTVDLSYLPKGVYIYRIFCNDQNNSTTTGKIIVE
jgi:Secretion system C-terminal sorting domain